MCDQEIVNKYEFLDTLLSWINGNKNQTCSELTPDFGICWAAVLTEKICSLFILPSFRSRRNKLLSLDNSLRKRLILLRSAKLIQLSRSNQHLILFFYSNIVCLFLLRVNWTLCVFSWEKATTECLWCGLILETRWDAENTEIKNRQEMKNSRSFSQLENKWTQTKQVMSSWGVFFHFWQADVKDLRPQWIQTFLKIKAAGNYKKSDFKGTPMRQRE